MSLTLVRGLRAARHTPCRTITVTPQYRDAPRGALRSYVDGYRVEDDITGQIRHVPSFIRAREVAEAFLARRPQLDWSEWMLNTQNDCHFSEFASADGVVKVTAFATRAPSRAELTGGLFSIGYTAVVDGVEYGTQWWTDIRKTSQRLAHIRAYATAKTDLMLKVME